MHTAPLKTVGNGVKGAYEGVGVEMPGIAVAQQKPVAGFGCLHIVIFGQRRQMDAVRRQGSLQRAVAFVGVKCQNSV